MGLPEMREGVLSFLATVPLPRPAHCGLHGLVLFRPHTHGARSLQLDGGAPEALAIARAKAPLTPGSRTHSGRTSASERGRPPGCLRPSASCTGRREESLEDTSLRSGLRSVFPSVWRLGRLMVSWLGLPA